MKLIVGLGNPGEKYEKTRHNLGFMIVEQFLKDAALVQDTIWDNATKLKSDIFILTKNGEQIVLAKPKTYMNNSGMAVKLIADFYKIASEDIWIVHDEIDIPLGGMRIRLGGGDAGHRGIQSVRQHLGTEKFWRFRMGVGHPKRMQNAKFKIQSDHHVEDYVLGKFGRDEWGKVRELIKRGSHALLSGLEHGLEQTMNTFNTK